MGASYLYHQTQITGQTIYSCRLDADAISITALHVLQGLNGMVDWW